MDDARALLNSLMGVDRDAKPEQRRIRHYTDDDMCRSFLLGLCPHGLFKSTKMDLGPCDKDHNDNLKEMFDEDTVNAPRYRRKWRSGHKLQLRGILEGVDRRISQNQLRIAREKEGGIGATEEQKRQIAALKEDVSEKLRLAEKAADDGKFEESRGLIKETEAAKRRIEDFEAKRFEKYRKENICEVCGLIIDDQEAEDMKTGRGWHSNGKQHIGYALIRARLKDIAEEEAKDRENGLPSPSHSPVRMRRQEGRRRKSNSVNRVAKASRSKSGRRLDRVEDRRRAQPKFKRARASCSQSPKKRPASPSRSPKRKKADGRKRGSPSPKARSKSRRRSRSRRKKCSRSLERKRSKAARHTSPVPPDREVPAQPPPPPPPPKAEMKVEAKEIQATEEEPDSELPEVRTPVRFFLGLRPKA